MLAPQVELCSPWLLASRDNASAAFGLSAGVLASRASQATLVP
jgi:hypothetical protein